MAVVFNPGSGYALAAERRQVGRDAFFALFFLAGACREAGRRRQEGCFRNAFLAHASFAGGRALRILRAPGAVIQRFGANFLGVAHSGIPEFAAAATRCDGHGLRLRFDQDGTDYGTFGGVGTHLQRYWP